MKKRILSMILALTMVMGIFTGCGAGAGGSANEITVTEALNSILEDEGEVIIYRTGKNSYKEKATSNIVKSATGPNEKYYKWDGTAVYEWNPSYDRYDPFIVSGEPNFFIEKNVSETSSDIVIFTSKESNNIIRFGTCEHVEYEDESYMVFKTYFVRPYDDGINEDVIHTTFYIIKDTDFTKDKTIVADSADDLKGLSKNSKNGYYTTGFSDEEKEALGLNEE